MHPIAEKYGVSLVGDVSVELNTEVDFSQTLAKPLTIQITETESKTLSLGDWLTGKGGEVKNPFDAKIQTRDGKNPWAISKEVYFAVLNGTPLMEWLATPEDVELAIDGALFNYATHELGMDVKRATTSSKGGLEGHEGIVIRGIDDRPVKVTGDFIVKGAGGAIKDKIKADKEEKTLAEGDVVEGPWSRDNDYEDAMRAHYEKEEREARQNPKSPMTPEEHEEYMSLYDKKIIAVYPGRFQPMGQHHAEVFKEILNNPEYDEVFIATSDNVDMSEKEGTPKSPFNFEEKKQIIQSHDISPDNVVKVKNPYNAKEILQNYDPEEYSVVYLVGEKDMKESPRFQKTEGTTDDGWDWSIDVAPHVSINIPGHGEMSGTTLRQALKDSEPETFQNIMGWYDPITYDLIKNKLKRLEENQLPLGIFLRLIEETIEEAALSQMYGSWAGNLSRITPAGAELEEELLDEEDLEEIVSSEKQRRWACAQAGESRKKFKGELKLSAKEAETMCAEKVLEEDELEEISAVGAGAVEVSAGKRDEEEQGLIREIEDYLFSALGAS